MEVAGCLVTLYGVPTFWVLALEHQGSKESAGGRVLDVPVQVGGEVWIECGAIARGGWRVLFVGGAVNCSVAAVVVRWQLLQSYLDPPEND